MSRRISTEIYNNLNVFLAGAEIRECQEQETPQLAFSAGSTKASPSVKTEEFQEQQLPDPFTLPKNYPMDVDLDLKKGSLSVTTMRKFVTAIAHAIFALKRYPTLVEYTLVARQVVEKYSFLKNTVGNGHVCNPFSMLTIIYVYYLYTELFRNIL